MEMAKDNILYGINISSSFLHAQKKKKNLKTKSNLIFKNLLQPVVKIMKLFFVLIVFFFFFCFVFCFVFFPAF